MNCLNAFNSQSSRDKHYGNCIDHDAVKSRDALERRRQVCSVPQWQKQFKVPFIMYADFESILEPMEREKEEAKEE